MEKITLIRGQNGVLIWRLRKTGVEQLAWICTRDSFAIAVPQTSAGLEGFLVAVAQHSASLVGAISQVVQLDV